MTDREEEPCCLIQTLPRTAGTKEIRYTHTLSGEVEAMEDVAHTPEVQSTPVEPPPADPYEKLEEKLNNLEKRLNEMEVLLNELTS